MCRTHRYNSLDDFLSTNPLDVDGICDDGGGENFSVKGIELDAAILFADITAFSKRTLELNPIETLLFVNNYLAWMSFDAMQDTHGIIDKYIGDEIMLVFSNAFGSTDHFSEAVLVATRMIDNDKLDYHPHIGIASGCVVVGYTGTLLRYNCSVFGNTVSLAARCASAESKHANSIIFPQSCWKDEYNVDAIIPPKKTRSRIPELREPDFQNWKLDSPRTENIKNMGDIEIVELYTCRTHLPEKNATKRAKELFANLKERGIIKRSRNISRI